MPLEASDQVSFLSLFTPNNLSKPAIVLQGPEEVDEQPMEEEDA